MAEPRVTASPAAGPQPGGLAARLRRALSLERFAVEVATDERLWAALSHLPYRVSLHAVEAAFDALGRLDPSRPRVAAAAAMSYRACFPAARPEEVERFLASYMRQRSRKMSEDLHLLMFSRPRLYTYGAHRGFVTGKRHLARALASGRGVLLVSAHLGPMSYLSGALLYYFPDLLAGRRLRPCFNRRTDSIPGLVERVRSFGAEQGGDLFPILTTSDFRDTAERILAELAAGAIVLAQFDAYGAGRAAAPLTLLGGRVRLPAAFGAARLAVRAGAEVLPVHVRRLPADGADFRIEPAIEGPARAGPRPDVRAADPEVLRLAEALVLRLDAWIREDPPAWLYWDRLHQMRSA